MFYHLKFLTRPFQSNDNIKQILIDPHTLKNQKETLMLNDSKPMENRLKGTTTRRNDNELQIIYGNLLLRIINIPHATVHSSLVALA